MSETRSSATNELLSSESMRLVEMSGEVFYLAKVGHNDLPVAFKMTSCASDSVVLENAGHDFPKKLEYRLVGDREMSAVVSDGADKGFQLSYNRRDDG